MSDPAEPFEVVVRPGFVVTMASMVAVYAFFHSFVTFGAGSMAPVARSLNFGAAVTVLILLGTLVHELGHVLAGLTVGHRWTKAVLNGAGIGVVIEPRPHGWHRVTRSLAGPLAHLLFSLPLLAFAASTTPVGWPGVRAAETSVWWMGGLGSLFLAVLNALPIPGFDGAKALAGVRELVVRRSAQRAE